MTRKGEIIQSLIEASKWRKQLRYAAKAKRPDLAFLAVDNIFALHEKAIRALIKPRKPSWQKQKAQRLRNERGAGPGPRGGTEDKEHPQGGTL